MFPIALCPTHQSLLNEPCQKSYSGIIIPVNIYLTETRHKRTEHLRHLGSFAYTFCKDRNIWPLNWPLSSYYERFPVECFRGSRFSSLKANLTASSVPINECILELIWELEKTTSSRAMVEECFGFENFVLLCTSAASYQARLVNDNLISQSLICLRSCLEALRAQKSGILEGQSHEYCHLGKCNIKCLHDIHTNIQRYLDEVSRVILESDMTQKRNPWWLSIFYSVCIQSLVRKTLLRLPSYRVEACQQYLHLPIRVFVAMSSTFDPLIRSPLPDSSSSEEVPNEGDLVSARSAVNRARWGQIGIRNSGDYLKQLLEDKGATLLRPEDGFDSTTCQKIFDKMATRNNRALGMGKFANYLTNSIIDDANQA
ncbi:hypothetical protein PVAG01_11195 [Phlyctema vagabunda]|uniref:Uncharacterized protein n=1 Tax=Phlyctema vagabunda TaxID=108571 RepID=A0ABR4P1K9_9HELO